MPSYLNQGITPSDLIGCEDSLKDHDGDVSCLLFRFNHEIGLWEAYQIDVSEITPFSTRNEDGEWE